MSLTSMPPTTASVTDRLDRLNAAVVAQMPTVVLDPELLADERLTALWANVAGTSTLTVSGATVTGFGQHGAFRIAGTIDLLGFSAASVTIDVFMAGVVASPGADPDDDIHVIVRIESDGTWDPSHLSTAFPSVPHQSTGDPVDSPLHGLEVPATLAVLSSLDANRAVLPDGFPSDRLTIDGVAVLSGTTVHGTIDMTGAAWETVRSIAHLDTTADVTINVHTDHLGRWLTMRVDLSSTWDITTKFGVGINAVTMVTGIDEDGPPPRFFIDGQITIGEPVTIGIEAGVGDSTVRLRAGDHYHALTVPDVLDALGLESSLASRLPDEIANVGLTSLEIDVDVSASKIDRIAVALGSTEPITLLDDAISLQPSISIESNDPFGPDASHDIVLGGVWGLGTSALELVWQPMKGDISAVLRPGEPLPLDELLAALIDGDLPNITVALDTAVVRANTSSSALSIDLDAAEALRLSFGTGELVVANARFGVARPNGSTPFAWTFGGSLAVAGVHLLVAAERSSGSDWILDARGSVDSSIDLASVFRQLVEAVGDDPSAWPSGLPESHANLDVREIVLHHETSESITQVYVDLDLDVEVIHGIVFTHLTTGFEFDADGLVEAWLDAGFVIAEVEISLESRWSEDHGLELHGTTGPGQTIPIGDAISSLATAIGGANDIPPALASMTVQDLDVTYRTHTKDVLVHLRGDLPGSDGVQAEVVVEFTHSEATVDQASVYTRHIHAQLEVANLRLDADLSTTGESSQLVASAVLDPPATLSLHDLVVLVDDDLGLHTPRATISISEVLLVQLSKGTEKRTLMGMAMDIGLDLSGLPLIGPSLGETVRVGVQPMIATAALTKADVKALSELIKHGPIHLSDDGVPKGLQLETELQVGSSRWRLSLPVGLDSSGSTVESTPPPSTPATPVADADGLKWFDVSRTLGPARIARIGAGYVAGEIVASVDGSVRLGPLTLELMGLTASNPIDRLAPTFDLKGLGLDYKSGAIEIGGALMRSRDASGEDTYAGKIVVRTPQLSVSALGLYSNHGGDPSLFVYAVITAPLGGPSFFFVEGLALGFGYNRALIVPPIDEIATFPLIQEAIGSAGSAPSLEAEMVRLKDAIPARTGSMFFTAGVRFSSFQLIDTFLLVVVQIGDKVELDLLGLSRAVLPPAVEGESVPALAIIELAISAQLIPDDGTLLVRGQLTSASFVISPDCRLSGGFAIAAWFGDEHNGDFVATLGGYHPHFQRPDHFPTAPALALNWQVDSHLRVHGDMYFALTPTAMMAGAHLEATWQSGAMQAWFRAGVDFLISWKPLHYEASMTIQVGGSYTYHFFGTHHLSVSLSAELDIWGPPFAGRASLDLEIVTIVVRFGPQTKPAAHALDWTSFSKSFLPDATSVCAIAVRDGIVFEVKDEAGPTFVVDSTHLRVHVGSRIPESSNGVAVGVGPMGLARGELASSLTFAIADEDGADISGHFDVVVVLDNVPSAMWGGAVRPGLNDDRLLEGVVVGYDLVPRNTRPPAHTAQLDPTVLAFETHVHRIDRAAEPAPLRQLDWAPYPPRLQAVLIQDEGSRRRRHLVGSLQLPIRPDDVPLRDLVDGWRDDPRSFLEYDRHIAEVS